MSRLKQVILTAAGLVSDQDHVAGTIPEYDRALVELVGTLLGIDLSGDETRYAILGMLRELA